MLADLAATLAKQGAPTLGALIGSAIGGPAGTAIGGLAGKAIETLADALGTEPEPEAIEKAIRTDPKAAEKLAAAEAAAPDMLRIWEASIARAAKNDEAEAEKGFGAWSTRRTITHYVLLSMVCSSFFAALAGVVGLFTIKEAALSLLLSLVGSAGFWFMSWNGLVSGGRAVTDAIKAATAGKAAR